MELNTAGSARHKKILVDYLKKNLKKGYTQESLKWALIKQGYSRIAVENAIKQTNKELSREAPILKEKPIIKHQIFDQNNQPLKIKKAWWKRFFG